MERTVQSPLDPESLCARLAHGREDVVFFHSAPSYSDAWPTRIGLDPKTVLSLQADPARPLDPVRRLERLHRARLLKGGTGATGLAVLLSYELLAGPKRAGSRDRQALPDLHAWEVNESLTWTGEGEYLYTSAGPDRFARRLSAERPVPPGPEGTVRRTEARTSLPRASYLAAVRKIQDHIRKGDIYQANLTQRFQAPFRGERFGLWSRLSAATPSPRAAFVATERFAVASVSPELFLRGERGGAIETRPIKGTCRRETDPASDAAAGRRLVDSVKDNAELLMIVDLERNDLGRVCRTGTIQVPQVAALRSYPAVHHLVGVVQGTQKRNTGLDDLFQATFPGGSITGAPKERAIQILRRMEPVDRGFYTGSLFWFGDDGSFDSSILIRSVVLAGGNAFLGAGGGIVHDSDPEAEWVESCDKARAPAAVLGFVPEEAE